MAYENFKPTIWAATILQEKKKLTTFAPDCNYQFKGDAKLGYTVSIQDINRPTVGKYVPGVPIGDPETVAGESMLLKVDQADYFNYMIDDVDEAQAKGNIMDALAIGSSRELAEIEDSFFAKSSATEATQKITAGALADEAEALKAIDEAFVMLWDNSVTTKDDVTLYLPPWLYSLVKAKLIELKTNNDSLIAKGVLGMYNNAKIKMSNNLYNDGTSDNIILKTDKAYAFVDAINKTEAYRPEKFFSDAVRGLHTYGGKLVRPKELVVITASKPTE